MRCCKTLGFRQPTIARHVTPRRKMDVTSAIRFGNGLPKINIVGGQQFEGNLEGLAEFGHKCTVQSEL